MMRIILFVALILGILLVAAGGWWLASQTGLIVINAFGREISLSLVMGLLALIVLTLALFVLWNLVVGLLTLPSRLRKIRQLSRREKGYDALERALIASASGDTKGARQHAEKVKALMDRPALSGLLAARSAQADGDVLGAERAFESLLEDKRTRLAARRGLTETALQRHDHEAAISHAAQAFAADPAAKWAFETLFDAQVTARQWQDARSTLDIGEKKKHISRTVAARRRAVLLSAEASAAEIDDDLDNARKLAEKAVSAAPEFAPGAALAARLLVEAGKTWRAAGLLEDAWAGSPHPALSLAYRDLKEDEASKARTKRMRGLAQINPDHRESQILLAETAMEAGEPTEARSLLQPVADADDAPSSRICTLMAQLEKAEGNTQESHEWLRKSLSAPDEADWSDLDPEGPAFGYRAEDWARLVYSFGDAGTLIHPRHERFERVTRGGEHLILLENEQPTEAEPPQPEDVKETKVSEEPAQKEEDTEPVSKPDAAPKAKKKSEPEPDESKPDKAVIDSQEPDEEDGGLPRQPDDPGPGAKADPTRSVLRRRRKVH
jgi:HemY protein